MRQIVLDTETTGLETSQDHRIIEIGCVEMVDRKLTGRHYHQYVNPQRKVDEGAMEVHGITDQFLEDKPLFEAIVSDFFAFLDGAELISQAREEKSRLLDDLKEMLDSLTYDKLAAQEADKAENLIRQLKAVPVPLGKAITTG